MKIRSLAASNALRRAAVAWWRKAIQSLRLRLCSGPFDFAQGSVEASAAQFFFGIRSAALRTGSEAVPFERRVEGGS